MRIRKLSEGTINRIAAGEVVERPASVVKELVENAIDAGATQIDVIFRGGGKTLIKVSDNGCGMAADDLTLAIERHATSKLVDDNLIEIRTLGFRGEALPSIGAVARLAISSRINGSSSANSIAIEGGRLNSLRPAALAHGTEVEVRDLFFATPARLKFLKSDRSETAEAADVVRRLALANPGVGFAFSTEERRLVDVPPGEQNEERIRRIMGKDFMENAVAFSGERECNEVRGYAGLPTWSRSNAAMQHVFVNDRPVRDKLLAGAIRGAYADLMAKGRSSALILFVNCPTDRVDVNVHPAKAEVRFRDAGLVRSVVIASIRAALAARTTKSDAVLASAALRSFAPMNYNGGFAERQAAFDMGAPVMTPAAPMNDQQPDYPLGAARAQIHENYIVTQTTQGLVLVDQHAAHERLVYERLKRERAGVGIAVQPLLVPEVVDLDPAAVERIAGASDLLAQSGLAVEPFGDGAVIVREVPSALAGANIAGMIRDLTDELGDLGSTTTVEERINHILATMACHHSVRSGRALRPEEMNALLREMEATPNSGQCNHGRPTFIELKLSDIERLFGRR